MKLQQYQIEATRTCPDLGSEAINLAHMVLGISSENEEFIKSLVQKDKVNVGEEIADKFWYIANYCNIRGFDLKELYEDRFDFNQEEWEKEAEIGIVHLSKLHDYVKKYLAYNKPLNSDKEKDSIKALLLELQNEIDYQELELGTILQNNIDKLRIRFPDKFDTEKAINRNLDAERKELEK